MSAPLASKRQKNHLSSAVLTRRSTVMQREFQRRRRGRRKSTNLSTCTRHRSHDQKRTPVFTPYNPLQSRHVSANVRPLAVESSQLSPCGNCQEAFGEHRKSLNGMESDEELAFLYLYLQEGPKPRICSVEAAFSFTCEPTSGRTSGDSPLAVNP